jgi:dTDP-4-dehydrorhamnose reductase
MSGDIKILLLGKNGQVGWELQRALAPLGELVALDRHSAPHSGDLTRLDELVATVRALRPQVIVNAAAHTAVDKAETDTELAHTLNAAAPGLLAREAAALGAWLVHYSTDYVFDGSGDEPRNEAAPTAPLSAYGRSKLAGEQAIQASSCQHLIFRTSWVYAARGGNFAKTMLRLAADRDTLSVIDDQIGAPTGADLIADVTAHALRAALQGQHVSGLYHLVAAGQTSWCHYARHVLAWAQAHGQTLKAGPQQVQPIATQNYPTPAQRPLNSRLDTHKLQSTFGLRLPPWQAGVDRMLAEVLT